MQNVQHMLLGKQVVGGCASPGHKSYDAGVRMFAKLAHLVKKEVLLRRGG